MEQTIAVEWGRFLRDLEAKGIPGPKENPGENHNGSVAPESGNAHPEGTKQAVWQRLQDAISMPPHSEAQLLDAALAPGIDPSQPEPTSANRTFLEHFARPAAEPENRAPWLNAPEEELPAVAEPQPAANGEIGTYQVRSMWVGTGFEDRRVLVPPPAAETSAPELQQAIAVEDIPVETPAQAPEERLEEKENMWKSSVYADTPVSTTADSNGTTLNTTQDQDSSRWFVLNGVLGGAKSPQEAPVDAPAGNVPVLEVFSLAGGVGKTSLVATLGRALSSLGERVLLVEATPFGSLPYFFGACDCRPGVLRTFRPPSSSSDAPIRLASIDPESLTAESAAQGSLANEIQGWARGVSRVIVDVETRSTATVRGLSRMSPLVLVPLIPDVNSVLAANAIDAFFQHQAAGSSGQPDVFYVLNQFDPSLPLQADVRKMLQERLGERLLPFALQRTPAVSEALAEGMTIMDYAPDSPTAEDFGGLAKWLEEVMAPADMNSRAARWSER